MQNQRILTSLIIRTIWCGLHLVSLDGVAPSRMVGVSASVNLPLHHKVQKFSSGTGSPGWSWKKGRKWLWWWCGGTLVHLILVWPSTACCICWSKCSHVTFSMIMYCMIDPVCINIAHAVFRMGMQNTHECCMWNKLQVASNVWIF